MISLLEIVENRAAESSAEDPWREVIERAPEVGESLARSLRALLEGSGEPSPDHSHEDLVGLAAALMLKFRVHSEPVWSSFLLEQHLERFFRIPGATERALWEGMARVLPEKLCEVAVNLCDPLHRLLRFVRALPVTKLDVEHLLPFARRNSAFWYPLLWFADRADAVTPEFMAEALIGMGDGLPQERCVLGFRDSLTQADYLEACLAHARSLDPKGAEQLEAVARALS